MANPQLVFVTNDGTTTLPKTSNLADWNASDHEWGDQATPEPIPPNSQSNWQVLRIKNSSTSDAFACKFFLAGPGLNDALSINSGGDVPATHHGFFINQAGTIKGFYTGQGDSYDHGIPLMLGSTDTDEVEAGYTTPAFQGTLGTVGFPGVCNNGIAVYVDIGSTGVDIFGLQLVLGYAYVP